MEELMENLRTDIVIYVKNASDVLVHVGTLEDFIQIVAEDYTEEDFFSMVSDCYKWELPIVGEVDPEKCLKALIPDRLEAMIEEEREYRVEEVMQALEDVEPWDVYHTYGFDIFAVPSTILKEEFPMFMEKLKNFLKDTEYPF